MLRKVSRVLSVKSVALDFVAYQKNKRWPVSNTELTEGFSSDLLGGLYALCGSIFFCQHHSMLKK
jgi:hypothetical protein